jgi:hypothetical protein
VIDVYSFVNIEWRGQLLVTTIETFVLSVLLIILILYAIRHSKELKGEQEEQPMYANLNRSVSIKDMERMRQDILTHVMTEINTRQANRIFKRNKLSRTQSLPPDPCVDKEPDNRNILSFPCTPRTK